MGDARVPPTSAPDSADDLSGLQSPDYIVDNRPLCQGLPFVLTDAAHPRLVLKHGSKFLVMDQSASVPGCNTLGYGYYCGDTRHLSQLEMTLNDFPLSTLSSSTHEGFAGSFLYTNPQTDLLPQQSLMIQRDIVLGDAVWERIVLHNYSTQQLDIRLKLKYQSDFADMFEVRGLNLPARGQRMLPFKGKNARSLFLAYRGLDNILLETVIEFFAITPELIDEGEGEVVLHIVLPARQQREFQTCTTVRIDGKAPVEVRKTGFIDAKKASENAFRQWCNKSTRLQTEHELFDLAVQRSIRDLYILRQPTPKGIGLSAGVPWYCALFGRDSAITAWQIMPFLPDLARECLEVLARYQGTQIDQFRAESPGKIMHEVRIGELARIGFIPHTPYFGTVDATQLWLYVFAQYLDWSGDLEFAQRLWPNVLAALKFLDGALDERGYISYKRESEKGLENQGWKDSGDSVMHPDGTLAEAPIALCEVQAYLYAAWEEIGRISNLLGQAGLGQELSAKAADLKRCFYRDFWMESERFVALALDAHGQACSVISSNPGHCLFTGILDQDEANHIADRLMSPDMNCGWGIRTTVSFNPMSYHNGSVWPHDNAIIAEGLRKIGRARDAHLIMQSMIEVAQFEPDFRLPELFCGFERDATARPIEYPVSCSPQAWAAGALLQLLKSCLNLQPDSCNGILRIVEPDLPAWLGRVTLRGLRVGSAILDLGFASHEGISSCQVLHKSGKIKVTIET